LFAAGLITGEALLGILLAGPRLLAEGANPLALLESPPAWPGLIALTIAIGLLYHIATRRPDEG